jgi:two-component system sensor kinase FixL
MRTKGMADALHRKYLVALAVVTALVLGDQVLVLPYLARLTTDAPLINVAGRQRMLSQRLAKAALLVDREPGDQAVAALGEMKEVLALWSASQERLSRDEKWSSGAGSATSAELAALEPRFNALRDAAIRLIESREDRPADVAKGRESLASILEHEGAYLQAMDRLVGRYEAEARGRIENLRRVGWGLTALTLLGLVAIGRFILRPAVELIRRQVDDLRRSRDEMEDRVNERTRHLEAAGERHQALVEQFSHVDRTNAVGEMASALAHELNQPLGAIANYAEGCLIALDAPEPDLEDVRGALRHLRSTTMRANRIIDRVRRFVTRQAPTVQPFAANQAVNEAMEILDFEIQRHRAKVELDLASDLPFLQGDQVQIQQVLVNLIRNALQSLSQSQTLNPKLVVSTRPHGREGIEFSVTDNGEGVPPDHLDRIFDTYFSTRADGMGMGLPICRTIVEAHQGRLTVESEPGVRTTFRFRLPAAPFDHERFDGPHRG